MTNKKGFIGGFIYIIAAVFIIVGVYFWWQKMSVESVKNAAKKASEEAGVEINTQNVSPQGQVDAVRDMVGKIQDKENKKIENELNK